MNDFTKNLVLWAIAIVVLVSFFNSISETRAPRTLDYSTFMSQVTTGAVKRVEMDGLDIFWEESQGDSYRTVQPIFGDPKLVDTLIDRKIPFEQHKPEKNSIWVELLIGILPLLIIIGCVLFFMRNMQGGPGGRGGPMTFGKSRARLLSEDQIKTTFADVAGVEEAKEDVQEIVEFLSDPGKFQRLGGKIPRGVLMVGSPGTGKTLLAKAIAGEAKVPFFTISGSDFVEMFVGVGASRVRDMFEQAKKQAPCIVFIDEIDAVGRSRGNGMGGGHDEREQTLNQLLVEMDGFEANDGVIVIAATNRPDVLDQALLRPGRFDRQVVVPAPDIRGREQIIKVHMKTRPIADDVNPSTIAKGTPGFSGADLANLVNEAALFAAKGGKAEVTMREFELARDKILMGAERRSMAMSESEKWNTAYHEAGHAIVGLMVPEHDPVYKVSIIPRGRALGVTQYLPDEDRYSISKRGIESRICALYGGRIAEEITLGADGVTTGASNDIERATELARNMVTKWGLSEKLGPLQYEHEQESYLGNGAHSAQNVSGETAKTIDEEIRRVIDSCYSRATQILNDNREKLEEMAKALMKYETIDADQIKEIMEGKTPRPPKDWDDSDMGTPAKPAEPEVAERDSKDIGEDESSKDLGSDASDIHRS
ncbi:MAG TPA: ATP-dependent metalloprotease [Gammaproteobacteria bacterium]|nr:ATP-dependent metalloprotease [Gammaproteobacteria bacterium]MEC8010842.1 ATP-dependent zinc metalloprotease FtsH [Pseudomonadota bacterium]HBF07169.1 ATP-dependent metalloprotease [Gammaproteobacteria bacterium]HCK91840.1 ATP-dependent metalloprotease [Gammaproteobacteria bacterium]